MNDTDAIGKLLSEKPRVEILFPEGRLYSILDLFYCQSCSNLRSPLEVNETHERFYCPNCFSNFSLLEAPLYQHRCNRCFNCPRCCVTLTINSISDPITECPCFRLTCSYCAWNSQTYLGITENSPDLLVTELLKLEGELPANIFFHPLVNHYKKHSAELTRERNLQSALRDRYSNLSFGIPSSKAQIRTLSLSRTSPFTIKKKTFEVLEAESSLNHLEIKKDIWDSQLPEELKKSPNPKYLSVIDMLSGKHLLDEKTYNQQLLTTGTSMQIQSSRGMLSLDRSLVRSSNIPPTSLTPSDTSLHLQGNLEKSNIRSTQTMQLLLKLQFNYSHLPHSLAASSKPFSSDAQLPSRIPLVSKSFKRCTYCKEPLLAEKNLMSADPANFEIDNRALLWAPRICIHPPATVYERENITVILTIHNPLESPIIASFSFPKKVNCTVDVLTAPFEAVIGAYDQIDLLIDDDEDEEETIDPNSPNLSTSAIKRSSKNRILVQMETNVKNNTLGQIAYFHMDLSLKFQDILTNTHKLEIPYVISLGKILQQTIKRTESL